MSLALDVNRDDSRPVYLQIAAQIKNQISMGKLPPGTRLPSVRQMAQTLSVNRLTVHNAYSELQADGWVESTVGRGTFVLKQAQPLMVLSTIGSNPSADTVLRDIQSIKQIPTLRSLAYSEPDSSLFPSDEYWGSLAMIRREAPGLLNYESPQGDAMLRIELADLVQERGIVAMPDEIVVTFGAMQSLSLVTQTLTEPGDTVLIESPTYLGMIHLQHTLGLRPIMIPLDDEGLDLNVLEDTLKRTRPRFLYTIPTFQNPTGQCITPQRRLDLIELAKKYDLHIIEDDVYGMIAYDGVPPHALHKDYDNVTYISSISKMLMPGLRVGWVITTPEIQRRILSLRLATDLYGPAFVQRALAHFLHQGRLKAHLKRVLPIYRTRRDALLNALDRYMPDGVEWTQPAGGFSNWVKLPQSNMMTIYKAALKYGIAFTPGEAFLSEPGTNQYLRLCFSSQPAEDLDEIVATIANLIRKHRDHHDMEDTHILTPMV